MKKIIVVLLSVIPWSFHSKAQIAANWQVGTWSQFKTAAVTYTFDDNCSNQLPVALPLFDQYGYKVTFFAVMNWSPNWNGLKSASNNGHEVASHTVSHPTSLATLSLTQQDTELKQSQATINTNITNAKCLTLAYPNCNAGDLATTQKYYIAARNCQGAVESATPNDFYNISSIITGNTGSVQTATALNNKVAAAKTSKGWCVFLTHGIDNDGGYSPTQSTEIASHLSYMNTNKADFWIGTFLNVVKYIRERNAASLAEVTITSDSLKLTATDNLDNTVYNVPITVRRVLPAGWQNPKVYFNNQLINSSLVTVSGTTYIMFDVTPDQGPVYLANTTTTTPPPTVTTPVNYCQGATAVPLTATGTSLKWYTVSTGGSSSTTAPTPLTTTTGTTNYYVTQTIGGKESSPRTLIVVNVNATPAAPAVTSPVTYCQGATATALSATGTSLKWYTTSTGGSGSSSAPVPSTLAAGTTNYYVSQTTGSCEGPRATIAVTVKTTPAAPAVTSPVTYCQGETSTALNATGTSLTWYTNSSGGSGSSSAPVPSTLAAGTTNYYVSQTTGSCEGPRATIAVTVNTTPAAPAVTSPVTYCQGETSTALSATGTSLKWYTVSTGGSGSSSTPVPSTATAGTTNYYVSQTTGSCEGPRATIAVNVNATPAAPAVTSPVTYCQGETSTALSATGTSLKWYTVSTGGSGSSTAPIPSTTTTGTTNYYVSQTTGNCEGPRSTIAVTVNATPAAPGVTSPVTYCQGATATALSATGTTLLWYSSENGGTGNSTAPVPSTTVAWSVDYYVSETVNGCESPRSVITVTVDALPDNADAGKDQFVTTTLTDISANNPVVGIGTWSVSSGTGIFGDSLSAATTVSGLSYGENVFVWSVSNGSCPANTSKVTIHVGTAPSVQSINGPNNVTANETAINYSVTSNAGASYHWILPSDASIISANSDSSSIVVNYGTQGGNITVTEINPYGQASSSLPVTVSAATGITVQQNLSSCELYPNPFTESATLKINSGKQSEIHFTISDVNGSVLYNDSGNTNEQIFIGKELKAGVYFVQVACGNEIKVFKLIKI